LCCCNRIPQIGWFIENRNLFLILLGKLGGWEVQDHGANKFDVWSGPSLCFHDDALKAPSSSRREERKTVPEESEPTPTSPLQSSINLLMRPEAHIS
jgi:hypothetical protein